MIVRTIKCAVCGHTQTEAKPDKGWPGWGQLKGGALDGERDPHLCPEHLRAAGEFIDGLKLGGPA